MFRVRLSCAAVILALVALSCGGNAPKAFPPPTAPTAVTAFSERATDEPISRPLRELRDGNAATARSIMGYFSCIYCYEYGADSLNNDFGRYGSQFSFTSIRNEFSTYGSEFSSYSACNPYAFRPPRVYNASRSIYYGELTLNPYRLDGLNFLIPWLRADVCRH